MFKTKTFKQAITGAIVRAFVTTGALALGFLFVSTLNPVQVEQGDVMDNRPPAVGSPSFVLDKMGDKCWEGEVPADMAGKFPGHVVYAKGASGALVGGERMVAKALGQIFDGEDNGLTVYAFCR